MSKSPSSNLNHSRPSMALSANIARALSNSDEFKLGFPPEGLSTVSNRWWGSDSTGGGGEIHRSPEREKEGEDSERTGTSLLTSVRSKVVEEGHVTAKLGVSGKKVGKRQRDLLRRLFGSSLPRDWLSESS